MDDLDRPNLELQTEDEITLALHEIDTTYWGKLSSLQETTRAAEKVFSIVLQSPRPPQRPALLTLTLQDYAHALFTAEANRYPQSPKLGHWLAKLAENIRARVRQRLREIEEAGRGVSLAYHGMSEREMLKVVDDALRQKRETWTGPEQPKAEAIPKEPSVSKPEPASVSSAETIGKQIDSLREECRLTVEQLAEKIGVSSRSVYRHLSEEAEPRKSQLAAYEKCFSERLKRAVHLETSPKGQTSS